MKGERFLVPCIIRRESVATLEERLYITPVINLPHADIENEQTEVHYHADYRFIKHRNNENFPIVENNHSRHYFCHSVRPEEKLHGELQYFILPVINESFTGITPVENIKKSKLKHKCIKHGRCPHKGYSLSQVKPIDGEITCPLHGLKFDEKTGKVLNF